jgi:hypothetical protein
MANGPEKWGGGAVTNYKKGPFGGGLTIHTLKGQ